MVMRFPPCSCGRPVWATATRCHPPCFLTSGHAGNLLRERGAQVGLAAARPEARPGLIDNALRHEAVLRSALLERGEFRWHDLASHGLSRSAPALPLLASAVPVTAGLD